KQNRYCGESQYLLSYLLRTEQKVHTGRITEIVLVRIISGKQGGQARQVVVHSDRPYGDMLADFDIETTAHKHPEAGARNIQTSPTRHGWRQNDGGPEQLSAAWQKRDGCAGCRVCAAEQDLGERRKPRVIAVRKARTSYEVDNRAFDVEAVECTLSYRTDICS